MPNANTNTRSNEVKDDPLRTLSQKIATELFTDGCGVKADRLVHEKDGFMSGSGWAHEPAADAIERVIREELVFTVGKLMASGMHLSPENAGHRPR